MPRPIHLNLKYFVPRETHQKAGDAWHNKYMMVQINDVDKDVPQPWMIVRVEIKGVPHWYGHNKRTQEKTWMYTSYDAALQEILKHV